MKKAYPIRLVLSVLLLFTGSIATAQPQNPRTRVGIIIPLSGANADEGTYLKNAAELAKGDLAPGVQDKIEILFQDDQSNPAQAQGAFTRLTSQMNADVVIAVGNGAAKAIASLAERKGVPTFFISQNADVTNGMKYILRHHTDPTQEANVLKGELARRRLGRIFLVSSKTDYTTAQAHALKEAVGSALVAETAVGTSETDFSSVIEAIKEENADSVVLALEPGQFGQFAHQAAVGKLGVPTFGFSTMESSRDVRAAAKDMEGFAYAGPQPSEMFIQKYVKRYVSPPTGYSANIFDLVKIVALGAEKFGSDRDALNDYFHSLKNVGGALGVYTTKEGFLAVRPYLKEIRNGQFRLFLNDEGVAQTPLKGGDEAAAQSPEGQPAEATPPAESSGNGKKIVLLVLLALLIAVVGVGIWFWSNTRDQSKVQDMVHGLLSASGISERLTKSRMMSDEELDILKKTSRQQKDKQGALQTALFGAEATTSLTDKLFRAGYFTKEERQRHERRQILFPVVGAIIGLVTALSFGAMLWVVIILPILGLAIGWQLPSSLLDRAIARRTDDTLYYLPLVIEQISIGVSSSLDIWPCISNILDMAKVRNTLNPVTELFLYVEKLVGSGLSLQEALDEVAVAAGITQVQMAFKFLGQCAEHGGEVSKQLQDLANAVMRERQTQIEAKIAALPVKATGPLFLVFAGFFILMLAGIFTRLLTSLKI